MNQKGSGCIVVGTPLGEII